MAGTEDTVSIPGTEISLRVVWIPGGELELGSRADEAGRDEDEGPVRRVRLGGFWMGVHEVTGEAFAVFRHRRLDSDQGPADTIPFDVDAVTRPSPPYDDPAQGMGGDDHPAVGMTRQAALHYARWLSLKTGRLFRLPTEAEWEFACRGAGGPHGLGSDGDRIEDHAWLEANSGGTLQPVGLLAPNARGVHDLLGNAAEWVADTYRPDAYAEPAEGLVVADPLVGEPGRGRGVVRGGAFDDEAARARCAERLPESAAWKRRDPQVPKSRWWNTDAPHVGFRLVSPGGDHTLEEIHAYWAGVLGR